jgi:hypothetical protein
LGIYGPITVNNYVYYYFLSTVNYTATTIPPYILDPNNPIDNNISIDSSSGSFVIPELNERGVIDFTVIGGGGSGNALRVNSASIASRAGGGGSGYVNTQSNIVATPGTSLTLTIGKGGPSRTVTTGSTASTDLYNASYNGGNSSLIINGTTYTANGGQQGHTGINGYGGNGGSGGGCPDGCAGNTGGNGRPSDSSPAYLYNGTGQGAFAIIDNKSRSNGGGGSSIVSNVYTSSGSIISGGSGTIIGANGLNGYGNGGVGSCAIGTNVTSGSGGSGIIIIRFQLDGLPSASFTYNPTHPYVGQTTNFIDTSTNELTSLWNFGD